MWFLRNSKSQKSPTEEEIQAVRQDTLRQIDATTKSAKKLNDLIKKKDFGVTEMIFLASGGSRRK